MMRITQILHIASRTKPQSNMRPIKFMPAVLALFCLYGCHMPRYISLDTPAALEHRDSLVEATMPLEGERVKALDTVGLPHYNINNRPISLWMLKEDTFNIGFIIAGHAEAAICRIASAELLNTMDRLDHNPWSMASFGVAFDIRHRNSPLWSIAYHNTLRTLERRFYDLAIGYPNDVSTFSMQASECEAVYAAIKSETDRLKERSDWDSFVLEHEQRDLPLLLPFTTVGTEDTIRFSVPKTIFGKLPIELALVSYREDIKAAQLILDSLMVGNEDVRRLMKAKRVEPGSALIWSVHEGSIKPEMVIIRALPDIGKMLGWEIVQKDGKDGRIVERRSANYEEVKEIVNDPIRSRTYSPENIDSVRKELRQYEALHDTLQQEWNEQLGKVDLAQQSLKKEKVRILHMLAEIKKRDYSDHIIDAMLRGWPFSTEDSVLNKKLDEWYDSKRPLVWEHIFSMRPDLRVKDRLGGIFHSDDVFFQVDEKGDSYEITPIKITGGTFVQVIDKQTDLVWIYSPMSDRKKPRNP